MRAIRRCLSKFKIVAELLSFFWQQKLWWMIPLVLIILFFGLLIVFTQGTALAPFVYALF